MKPLIAGLLWGLVASAYGANEEECTVLLCLLNPNGPEAVAECVPPIERWLERLQPFPNCPESGAVADTTPPYPPCPANLRAADPGDWVGMGESFDQSESPDANDAARRACVGTLQGALAMEGYGTVRFYDRLVWQARQPVRRVIRLPDGSLTPY